MLISPPFLLTRQANETEDDWINRCMEGGQPGDGAFPLSLNLGWHGGMHLIAPMNGGQPEPVRAIADGTVVFMRAPTPQPGGPLPPEHPQAYRGQWTDNGVVVLRHETEIGEGANARVQFFSIYMHLSAVQSAVAQGRTIYRKSELGTAGQIYGSTQRRIHFEIVCDDANLARLVGRASGDLPIDANGRTDAIYGQNYFLLPGGTPFYGQKPLDHLAAAHIQPPKPSPNAPLPAIQALPPTFTSEATDTLVVGLLYAHGGGANDHRGSAFLCTLSLDGASLGDPLEERDAEYNLYTRANEISKAHPANARPTASAVYELLRFGRVVNSDNETLVPANVPHWRLVRHRSGQGWVDLNAVNVRKFSDADFPQWRQWRLIDDSAEQDSRCDSQTLKSWLDVSGDGQVEPAEATTRLADAALAPKLAHAICKFPTEWDAATIDQRWGWLKTATAENPVRFTEADFELLRQHIQALAFFPGGTGLPANQWHFEPREFVKHFRLCGWLAATELAQTLPRRRPTVLAWAEALRRAERFRLPTNVLARKYLGSSRQRIAHAIAQVFIETDLMNTMTEYSNGNGHPYRAFFGRGLMQLTWPSNYEKYRKFRQIPGHTGAYQDTRITATSTHVWESGAAAQRWAPRYDPSIVASDDYAAGDSGGFYWVSKTFRGTSNINRVCDLGHGSNHVGYTSWLVNGGGNGYRERQLFFAFVWNELNDEIRRRGTQTWTYPGLTTALTGSFPPGNPVSDNSISVNYEQQIP